MPASPAEPAAWISHLRLHNFRNYAQLTLELAPGLTLVVGANAQGKTNLLEAIATAALTRSPRAASSAEMLRWDTTSCAIDAAVERPPAGAALGIRLHLESASGRVTRSTLLDGQPRPARQLLGQCPIVLFTPADLSLVSGGPERRRRLLDILLSQVDPAAADDLSRYRRVLQQRNTLLRQLRTGHSALHALADFTATLTALGGQVRSRRCALLAELAPAASSSLLSISDRSDALTVEYLADGQPMALDLPAAAAGAQLASTLAQLQTEERARGVTLAGPQLDDIQLLINRQPARLYASQGQQRSLVLALKLAEVQLLTSRASIAPVLLLDDVLGDLDSDRRRLLLDAIPQASARQLLVTTTDDAARQLHDLNVDHRLEVDHGRVVPVTIG